MPPDPPPAPPPVFPTGLRPSQRATERTAVRQLRDRRAAERLARAHVAVSTQSNNLLQAARAEVADSISSREGADVSREAPRGLGQLVRETAHQVQRQRGTGILERAAGAQRGQRAAVRESELRGMLESVAAGELDRVALCVQQKGPHVLNLRSREVFQGQAALHVATCHDHLELVKYLLRKGAEVNLGTLGLTKSVQRCHEGGGAAAGAVYAQVDITGTPLDYAARHGSRSVVPVLLEAGAVGGEYLGVWAELRGPWPKDRVRGCDEAAHELRLALRGGEARAWAPPRHHAHPPAFRRAARTLLLIFHARGRSHGAQVGLWSLGSDIFEYILQLLAFPLSAWLPAAVEPLPTSLLPPPPGFRLHADAAGSEQLGTRGAGQAGGRAPPPPPPPAGARTAAARAGGPASVSGDAQEARLVEEFGPQWSDIIAEMQLHEEREGAAGAAAGAGGTGPGPAADPGGPAQWGGWQSAQSIRPAFRRSYQR